MAIRRMPPASGAGTNPFETPRMNATIVGVEIDSSRVMCRDTFGNEFIIDGSLRAKGSGLPASGERWILAKIGGRWTLDLQVGAAPAPVITGNQGGLNPVVKQMLKAMADLGLVVDLTTDTDPVEAEDDSITDPSVPVAGDEEYFEDEFEDFPTDPYYTAEAVVPVGATVDDDPVSGSMVAADLFSAVSYNLAFWMGPKRAGKDLKRLFSQCDVFGLQEQAPSDRDAVLANFPANWGRFRPTRPVAGHTNPIYWNKDVWEHLDEGTRQMVGFDGPGTLRPARAFNWVLLRHKATNAKISFVNVHMENAAVVQGVRDPNYKPTSARHVERWNLMMPIATEEIQKLLPRGAVILFGDLNCDWSADNRVRSSYLYTAAWGRLGMRANWDVLGLPATGTYVGGNRVIDWFLLANLVPGQVKFVNSKVLRGYHSDHRPVRTKFRVKAFTG